jgi:glycerate 2-kinase
VTRICLAPASFKGSLSATEAGEAMARGVRAAGLDASLDACPVADGGEGTLRALLGARGGRERSSRVCGPLGEPVDAHWALLDDGTAIVEMASAVGLGLVPEARRQVLETTTYGVGQLIGEALDAGARAVIVAVGGTATSDGGAGLAQALGVSFLGPEGPIPAPIRAADLGRVRAFDASREHPALGSVTLIAACDVDNPLIGPQGAAAVYAPQKGASPAEVLALETGLGGLASLVGARKAELPGAGAGGGAAFGLSSWCSARLVRGADLVLDAVRFDERIRGADLVLTGEGRLDGQSLRGKAVLAVARRARAQGVFAVALCGALGPGIEEAFSEGLGAAFSLCPGPIPAAEAMAQASGLLEVLTTSVVRCRFGAPAA